MNKRWKLFSLEHIRRRKDRDVFTFLPAGKGALDEAFTISRSLFKHTHTHTPLPTKLIIVLNYFKGGQGGRHGSDYLEEKEIKVVWFSSLYLPINGLLPQKTLALRRAVKG